MALCTQGLGAVSRQDRKKWHEAYKLQYIAFLTQNPSNN